jgi:hypothetical protein
MKARSSQRATRRRAARTGESRRSDQVVVSEADVQLLMEELGVPEWTAREMAAIGAGYADSPLYGEPHPEEVVAAELTKRRQRDKAGAARRSTGQ